MAILAYDDVMLREPRLLVPGSAPLGLVKINNTHPLAKGLFGFSLLRKIDANWDLVRGNVLNVQRNATTAYPDYINAADGIGFGSIDLAPLTGLSIICWMKSVSLAANGDRLISILHSTNNEIMLYASSPNAIYRWDDGSVTDQTASGALTKLTDGNWHQLAMTYDGAAVINYVDAIPVAAPAARAFDFSSGGVSNIAFGAQYGYLVEITANIKIASIYTRGLTEAEVTSLYLDPCQFLIPA